MLHSHCGEAEEISRTHPEETNKNRFDTIFTRNLFQYQCFVHFRMLIDFPVNI